MGDQGLLQELPAISALLREAGGDREQSDAEDRTLGRLKAMADLALNHRMAQGSLCSIVGGFDALYLEEGPQAISLLEQLPAGANRFGPRRSLAALGAQLHHPLQRAHKRLADRLAALSNIGQSIVPSFHWCHWAITCCCRPSSSVQSHRWRRDGQRWR